MDKDRSWNELDKILNILDQASNFLDFPVNEEVLNDNKLV
jgi:hypothetical protein